MNKKFILFNILLFLSLFALSSGADAGIDLNTAKGAATGLSANSSNIIERLQNLLIKLWDPIVYTGKVVGFAFIVFGLYSFYKSQVSPQQGTKTMTVFATIIGGVLLLNFTQYMHLTGTGIFGDNAKVYDTLAYTSFSGVNKDPKLMVSHFVFTALQVFGLIGLFKAVLILKTPAEQQGGFGKAIKVAIGATIALNIPIFIQMTASYFKNTSIGTVLNSFIGTG